MYRRLRYLVRTSDDRDRQLMISGLILAMICLALYINLTIILSKRSSSSIKERIKNNTNETTNSITDMTSTNLPNAITSKKSVTNSVQLILSTTTTKNQRESYRNYSLRDPLQYETFGRSLGNSLYHNLDQQCRGNGYISSVSLRLFSNWTDNTSLYLFIISGNILGYNISSRYAINPQKNTTEWQTIKIPSRTLPIFTGNCLAIGMQESSNKNQIYGIQMIISGRATNINKDTTKINPDFGMKMGVALGYTVVQNAKTTMMKSILVH